MHQFNHFAAKIRWIWGSVSLHDEHLRPYRIGVQKNGATPKGMNIILCEDRSDGRIQMTIAEDCEDFI
jgi:hypothetical protein